MPSRCHQVVLQGKQMRRNVLFTGLVLTLTMLGFMGPAAADNDGKKGHGSHQPNPADYFVLAGRTFVIKGVYTFIEEALIPPDVLQEGDTFVNCYFFGEDGIEDSLVSGLFVDPLIPALGTWVQHGKNRVANYSAYADDTDNSGLLLVQNGYAGSVNNSNESWLKAHSTVSVPAIGLVLATVLSTGYEVEDEQAEECFPPDSEV